MRTLIALLVLTAALPSSAQYYGPPPRDLQESVRVLQEALQHMEASVNSARDEATILGLVARVQNTLVGKQAAGEMTEAMKLIDDFLERRERQDDPLSPEHLRTVRSVRREVEAAHTPPYATFVLRERLHHEFVHPLQRKVMKNVREAEQIEAAFEFFRNRNLEFLQRESMGGISAALAEVQPPVD